MVEGGANRASAKVGYIVLGPWSEAELPSQETVQIITCRNVQV